MSIRRHALLSVWLLASCGRTALPELPAVTTAAFDPSVRQVVEDAMRQAEARPSDAHAVERLGMVLHAHDQFGAAVACYRRAAALDPRRVSCRYYHGAALLTDGKHSEAIQPLTDALALEPGSVPIRLKLADALREAGLRDRAEAEYRGVNQRDPSIAAAHFGLGRVLSGDGAIAQFRRALEIFPRYGAAQFALAAEYRRQGLTKDAETALRGYEANRMATPPFDDPLLAAVFVLNAGPTGMIRRAQALEREGRLREAAEVCERVTTKDPKFAEAWLDLVSLYGRLNEPQKLEHAYARATELAPGRSEPHYNYGVFLLQSNRVLEARKAFEKAVEADPRNADAWNNLAATVERSGDLARAAECYRRAIELRPDSRASHFGLGRIYANQGRLALAIAELEKTIATEDENTPGYLYALGAVHARAGQRQQAVELLTRARSQASNRGQVALVSSIERDMRSLGAAR